MKNYFSFSLTMQRTPFLYFHNFFVKVSDYFLTIINVQACSVFCSPFDATFIKNSYNKYFENILLQIRMCLDEGTSICKKQNKKNTCGPLKCADLSTTINHTMSALTPYSSLCFYLLRTHLKLKNKYFTFYMALSSGWSSTGHCNIWPKSIFALSTPLKLFRTNHFIGLVNDIVVFPKEGNIL